MGDRAVHYEGAACVLSAALDWEQFSFVSLVLSDTMNAAVRRTIGRLLQDTADAEAAETEASRLVRSSQIHLA